MLDEEEFRRWMAQALHTLGSAERDAAEGDYGWACFKAEQAAQLALKALLRGLGETAFGHSLTRLLQQLSNIGVEVPAEVMAAGRRLEGHYIPSRYPDAYPAGSPFEFYDDQRAQEALAAARQVMEFGKGRFADVQRADSEEGEAGSAG